MYTSLSIFHIFLVGESGGGEWWMFPLIFKIPHLPSTKVTKSRLQLFCARAVCVTYPASPQGAHPCFVLLYRNQNKTDIPQEYTRPSFSFFDVPPLALSKSGYGSEPFSSLSAGFSQLPFSIFTCILYLTSWKLQGKYHHCSRVKSPAISCIC